MQSSDPLEPQKAEMIKRLLAAQWAAGAIADDRPDPEEALVHPDPDLQALVDDVHPRLSELLNAERTERDRLIIPKPRAGIRNSIFADIRTIPEDLPGDKAHYSTVRTAALVPLLTHRENEAALLHELTHIALMTDKTNHTQNFLYISLPVMQKEAARKNGKKGEKWLEEFLCDQAARLILCDNSGETALQKMDAQFECQMRHILKELYPVYETLSRQEMYGIYSAAIGVTGTPDDYPPSPLRVLGEALNASHM